MRRLHRAAALPLLTLALALAAAITTTAASAAAVAKAPAAAPPNVTAEMAKGGCKAFAELISASPDASSTYQSAVEGGLTVFCPSDDAVRAFLPKYKNLSADAKAELLLFHAVPVHYSLGGLKSNNGPMNTLATDGAARNFNFTVQNQGDVVTIRTAAGSAPARVKSTAVDRDPLAIYVISAVVEPVELFSPAPSPSPAPAPAPAPAAADAPKAAGKAAAARQRHAPPAAADAPGPGADDNAAPVDQKDAKKKNAAAAGAPCARWWLAAALAAVSAAFA